jgi:hypothetical protein
MTEATKTTPAPLDAYETAKPNEPVFTLQGGDPLAAPLVRLWALLARVRANTIRGDSEWIYPPLESALRSIVEHDPRECDNLLLRATQAEVVSWEMDSYAKGEESEAEVKRLEMDEFTKLDVYDIRRRFASAISSFASDVAAYKIALSNRGVLDEGLAMLIDKGLDQLNLIRDQVKIERRF